MADQPNYQSSPLFPRGVADARKQVGCLSNGSGMCAVSLADGSLLWQSEAGRRPLLIHGDKLIAASPEEPNVAQVVALDLSTGEPAGPPVRIQFPAWVDILDQDTFSCRAFACGDDVVLRWQAKRRYRGGAAPSAEVLQEHVGEDRGAVRISLRDGSTEDIPPESIPLEASCGEEGEKAKQAAAAWRGPCELAGRLYYMNRDDDSTLVAYDPSKQREEWARKLPSSPASKPPPLRP